MLNPRLGFSNECRNVNFDVTKKYVKEELLPKGAIIISEREHFIIYKIYKRRKRRNERRILFDSRFAQTSYVSPDLRSSPYANATFDLKSGKIFVNEGRHRAVAASQGFKIPKKLGGTKVPYWLDYSYSNTRSKGRHEVIGLTQIPIRWTTEGGHYFNIDKVVQEDNLGNGKINVQ